MKKLLYILIVLSGIYIDSCNCQNQKATVIYIYVDLTEIEENGNNYEHVTSSIDNILERMNVDREDGGGGYGEVYLYPIYDFSSSKPIIVNLQKRGFNENRLTKLDIINNFSTSLENSLKSVVEDNFVDVSTGATYRKSYIFKPLCEGLKKIRSRHNDWNKHIIIFSDMLENSDLFSFYGTNIYDIKENPDVLINKLKGECNFSELSDLSIDIVYQPIKEKDELLEESRKFWTKFFYSSAADKSIKHFSFDTYFESPKQLTKK